MNNHRPVHNLTIISKVIEKCVSNQLSTHLNTNNLFSQHQSAYRHNFSCETAIMKVLDDVYLQLNPQSYIVMSFLDFSAAFDTVDHDILINTLKTDFNMSGVVLNWFSSYLNNRSYKVKIKNTFSEPQPLNFGVPQGSILGPTLYM